MPANAGIRYSRGVDIESRSLGVLDHPPSRMMTQSQPAALYLAHALNDARLLVD
jgi:hypothetical protein